MTHGQHKINSVAVSNGALVLSKDVAVIADKIVEANKILTKINAEIDSARAELIKTQEYHRGELQSHRQQLTELQQEVSALHTQKSVVATKASEEVHAVQVTIQELQQHQTKLQSACDVLNKEVAIKKNELEIAIRKLHFTTDTQSTIEQQIHAAQNVLQQLLNNHKEYEALEEKAVRAEQRKVDALKSVDALNTFRMQLEEKEVALNKREHHLMVMEYRLTPEYKKVFGQFANLN